MKRFTGHTEPWGQFVDAKVKAPELLQREITRKTRARVWISGVCDPYQPIEAKYRLTRQCLEILAQNNWPVTIQTRSALVLRDLDILQTGREFEVGMSVTTADERIRRLFEPDAPPIEARIHALDELHQNGLRTFVMIAPMLPGSESLAEMLVGKVDSVILDRMNYHHADRIYRRYGLEDKFTDDFFAQTERILSTEFARVGIVCS